MIRKLNVDDAQNLTQIHQEALHPGWSKETFTLWLQDSAFYGYAFVVSDNVRGFILLRKVLLEHEIITFAVAPEYQGQGIGESLLKEVQRFLSCDEKIFLEVRESNHHARHLYEKCGFVITGKRANYYNDGNSSQDAILYTWGTSF